MTISQIQVGAAVAPEQIENEVRDRDHRGGEGAAGAAFALKKAAMSSSPSTPGSTGTTITAGSPVFGPPR